MDSISRSDMTAWYAMREQVKLAVDIKDTARADAQIDRLIRSNSEAIDGLCHRQTSGFLPTIATRYFDWPNTQSARSWRLWLDDSCLAGAPTSVVTGGVTLTSAQYFLEPVNAGPPYTWLEINLAGGAAWSAGSSTWQHSIAITGPWGYQMAEYAAGSLAAALTTTTATTMTVTDGASVGVGALVRIDSERIQVTGRSWNTSGWTAGALGATNSAADSTVVCSGGTAAFTVGESILIDSEQMLIVDLVGSNLIVKRAWNGSVLATHSGGATINVSRTLTITRGANGTTAATHLISAPIVRCKPPDLVETYCVALTLNALEQERSAYARVSGEGAQGIPWSGSALRSLASDVSRTHGRQGRSAAI